VNPENLLPSDLVRPIDENMAIKPAGAQQRRIEDLRAVRRRHQDHADLRIEPVHLDQELVEGLFPLVVTADGAETACLPQRVEFVDKDDAGGLSLGLGEKVPDTGRAEADEHLDEFRTGEAEKGNAALAGDRLGQQGLAAPGRTDQQDALGNASADFRELARRLQEFDDLDQLLFGLVHPRDVGEGDVEFVLHVDLRLVLAQGHEARLLAAHPFHQEIPDADEQQQREDPREEVAQEGGFDFTFEGDGILFEHCGEIRIDADRFKQLEVPRFSVDLHFPLDLVGRNGNLRHLARLQEIEKLAVRDDLGGEHRCDIILDKQDHPDSQQNIPDRKFIMFLHISFSPRRPFHLPVSDPDTIARKRGNSSI